MDNREIASRFQNLNTAVIVDACLRENVPYHIAKAGIKPLNPNTKIAGHIVPVKHHGSVDVFLEAVLSSNNGDIMVIDNQGRADEACVGDLTALELRAHGMSGFIIWGFHRDEKEILEINFPTFSYGSYPAGPVNSRYPDNNNTLVTFTGFVVTTEEVVFADVNGVVFINQDKASNVVKTAEEIWQGERIQIEKINNGVPLTEQFQFSVYLSEKEKNQSYTFRDHLRKIGGEIEE